MSKVKRLKKLDLTDVLVNEMIIELLSDKFKIGCLRLCETRAHIDRALKLEGLLELYVENNENFLTTCLYEPALVNLRKLEIVNCPLILLTCIENFINGINDLKELILRDCIKLDKNMFLLDFLRAVFSNKNGLKAFVFEYTVQPLAEILQFFPSSLEDDVSLTELNLTNNAILSNKVSEIIMHTTKLRVLKLQGVELNEQVTLSYLYELEELYIDYFHDFSIIIATLNSNMFKKLEVANKHHIKSIMTKNVNFDNLYELFRKDYDLEVFFINCKVTEPVWLWEKYGKRVFY